MMFSYTLDQTYRDTRVISFPAGHLGCNCSIVINIHSKHAILIDPGDDPALIKNIVQTEGITVTKMIHTHAHFDHIAGSDTLKSEWLKSGWHCPIYLHKDDLTLYQNLQLQGTWFGFKLPPPGSIDSFLNDNETFSFCDQNTILTTMHTPGHTQGSCCFYTETLNTPLLFSGDTLFNESIGRTDLPGGDGQLILKSIKKRLLTLPGETRVIPGHGPHTYVHHEQKYNPFF